MTVRLRWLTPLVLALLTCAAQLTAAERSPFDVLSYGLSVKLSFEESPPPDDPDRALFSVLNTLEGEATISVRNASNLPLEAVPLVLNRLMKATEVRVGGDEAAFDQALSGLEGLEELQVRTLSVRLAEPLSPGRELALSIRYGGQLAGYPESGMLYVRETLDPDFTILRSETFSYPQVGPPAEEAIGFAVRHDPFDQRLEITVPEGHSVAYGGRTVSTETEDASSTFTFASHEPAAAITLAIAPYRVLERGGHTIYHFAESASGAERLAAKMDQALELLTTWLGPRPGERGLIVAEIPGGLGSQAGALIIQTSDAFKDPRRWGQFYHELSHLWNPRDVDARPSRWNEGLAVFLQGLIEERLEGRSVLDDSLARRFERLRRSLETEEGLAGVAMADYGRERLTDYSYQTGALMFGVLYRVVGETRLLDFLDRYSREHREAGSTDRDFVESVGAELGEPAAAVIEEWFSTSDFRDRLEAAADWGELRDSY
jgi:hypothetical protein